MGKVGRFFSRVSDKSGQKTYIRYDLKKPCRDCPFLVTSELHQGICKALPDYAARMERDSFAHTCHKTDPRADSPEGKRYKGDVQHCAGAIALMAQGAFLGQSHIIENVSKSQWFRLKETKNTFKSMLQIAQVYYRWVKDGRPPGKTALDYIKESKECKPK